MNLSFLKKVGGIVVKGAAVAAGLQPLLTASIPIVGNVATMSTVISDLEQIAGMITTVEAVGQIAGMPGTQKLQVASPLVAQVILQSQLMVGHTIKDQALFTQAAKKIADGMADLLNSLHEDGAQERSTTT